MDIIITLPTRFCDAIFDGQKTIEIRRWKPKFFDPLDDVVYVCEKGTYKVVGHFGVSDIFRVDTQRLRIDFCSRFHKAACVTRREYFNYTGCGVSYFFFINFALRYNHPMELRTSFHRDQPPQSYYYAVDPETGEVLPPDNHLQMAMATDNAPTNTPKDM